MQKMPETPETRRNILRLLQNIHEEVKEQTEQRMKTQFRVRLHHLANKYVLKREKPRPTPGVSLTRSENQRNPTAPTFGERAIEWTLRMARNQLGHWHKNVYKVPYSENGNSFFKPSPANNVTSPSTAKSKGSIHCGFRSFIS